MNNNIKQFIKFGIVGVSGTIIDWAFYFIFNRWFNIYYLISKTLSFILAALNNYIWNRVWTFKSKEKNVLGEFIKFFIVSLVGLGLNVIIMFIIVSKFHLKDIYGLAIATASVMLWNFFANKYWTFKEKNENRN